MSRQEAHDQFVKLVIESSLDTGMKRLIIEYAHKWCELSTKDAVDESFARAEATFRRTLADVFGAKEGA